MSVRFLDVRGKISNIGWNFTAILARSIQNGKLRISSTTFWNVNLPTLWKFWEYFVLALHICFQNWFILLLLGLLLPLTIHGLPEHRVARERGTRPGSHFYHILDGFHYHFSYRRDGTLYYKCVFYERGCRGRAMYDRQDGFVHSATNPHNHEADLLYPDEMTLRRRILSRCERLEYVSFHRIIFEEGRRSVNPCCLFYYDLCSLAL